MPHRLWLVERVAFSFVLAAAAFCTAFIVYEKSGDVRSMVHLEERVLKCSVNYSSVCDSLQFESYGQLMLY